jgi:hypothetical protein
MTNKELRRLTREDLLELLLEQADAVEKQQRETENIKTKCSRLEEENDSLRRELSLLKESWDEAEEETEKLREALDQEKAKNRALGAGLPQKNKEKAGEKEAPDAVKTQEEEIDLGSSPAPGPATSPGKPAANR